MEARRMGIGGKAGIKRPSGIFTKKEARTAPKVGMCAAVTSSQGERNLEKKP
jgi:hypothetical protein